MALFSEDYPHDDGTVEFRWKYSSDDDYMNVLRVKDGGVVANHVKACLSLHRDWVGLFDCIERYCRRRSISIDKVEDHMASEYRSKENLRARDYE